MTEALDGRRPILSEIHQKNGFDTRIFLLRGYDRKPADVMVAAQEISDLRGEQLIVDGVLVNPSERNGRTPRTIGEIRGEGQEYPLFDILLDFPPDTDPTVMKNFTARTVRREGATMGYVVQDSEGTRRITVTPQDAEKILIGQE